MVYWYVHVPDPLPGPYFNGQDSFPLPAALLGLFLVDKFCISRISVIHVIPPLDSFIKMVHLASRWTLLIRSGASLPEELPFLAGEQ